MNTDSRVGIDCRGKEQDRGEQQENWDNCNRTAIKKPNLPFQMNVIPFKVDTWGDLTFILIMLQC